MDDDERSVSSVGSAGSLVSMASMGSLRSNGSMSSWASMGSVSKAKAAGIGSIGTLAYFDEVENRITSMVKRDMKKIKSIYSCSLPGAKKKKSRRKPEKLTPLDKLLDSVNSGQNTSGSPGKPVIPAIKSTSTAKNSKSKKEKANSISVSTAKKEKSEQEESGERSDLVDAPAPILMADTRASALIRPPEMHIWGHYDDLEGNEATEGDTEFVVDSFRTNHADEAPEMWGNHIHKAKEVDQQDDGDFQVWGAQAGCKRSSISESTSTSFSMGDDIAIWGGSHEILEAISRRGSVVEDDTNEGEDDEDGVLGYVEAGGEGRSLPPSPELEDDDTVASILDSVHDNVIDGTEINTSVKIDAVDGECNRHCNAFPSPGRARKVSEGNLSPLVMKQSWKNMSALERESERIFYPEIKTAVEQEKVSCGSVDGREEQAAVENSPGGVGSMLGSPNRVELPKIVDSSSGTAIDCDSSVVSIDSVGSEGSNVSITSSMGTVSRKKKTKIVKPYACRFDGCHKKFFLAFDLMVHEKSCPCVTATIANKYRKSLRVPKEHQIQLKENWRRFVPDGFN